MHVRHRLTSRHAQSLFMAPGTPQFAPARPLCFHVLTAVSRLPLQALSRIADLQGTFAHQIPWRSRFNPHSPAERFSSTGCIRQARVAAFSADSRPQSSPSGYNSIHYRSGATVGMATFQIRARGAVVDSPRRPPSRASPPPGLAGILRATHAHRKDTRYRVQDRPLCR